MRTEPASPASTSSAASRPARERLLATAEGSRLEAFGGLEWAALVGIALIWGSSFLWIDIGLDSLRPGVIALARVGLGALALAAIPRARQPLREGDWRGVVLLGVVWIGVPMLLFPIAQQWIDSAVAGMINGAVPVSAAAWATLFLRRVPGRLQLAGLALGLTGVIAISWPQLAGSTATALGVGLVAFSVLLYGLATNLAVPLQQRNGALPVLLRAQIASLGVIAPVALWDVRDSHFEWLPVLAMVPLGIFGTGLAFVLLTWLVGRVGSTRGTVPIYWVPPVAVALGVAVRGETVTSAAVFGTALVLAGAWLTSRRDGRQVEKGAPRPAAGSAASCDPGTDARVPVAARSGRPGKGRD